MYEIVVRIFGFPFHAAIVHDQPEGKIPHARGHARNVNGPLQFTISLCGVFQI
jgi:hypothetical protein